MTDLAFCMRFIFNFKSKMVMASSIYKLKLVPNIINKAAEFFRLRISMLRWFLSNTSETSFGSFNFVLEKFFTCAINCYGRFSHKRLPFNFNFSTFCTNAINEIIPNGLPFYIKIMIDLGSFNFLFINPSYIIRISFNFTGPIKCLGLILFLLWGFRNTDFLWSIFNFCLIKIFCRQILWWWRAT